MDNVLLDVKNLTHCFKLNRKVVIKAVDNLSFQIRRGEIFGLVGESGSGKSTVARCVMNVYKPTSGSIVYDGVNVCDRAEYKRNKKMLRLSRQLIFQDSASSLNPAMSAEDIICEPMKIGRLTPQSGSYKEEAALQLDRVGLDRAYLNKYPPELSGGMRQRVAIARALSVEPKLLVADECVASLDVSIQAQVLNLFKRLQAQHGFSVLFIAHDLSVVKYLCDRVGVMYRGKIVEIAPADELFSAPMHEYTKSLIRAIPVPDPKKERERIFTEYKHESFDKNAVLTEVAAEHFVMK